MFILDAVVLGGLDWCTPGRWSQVGVCDGGGFGQPGVVCRAGAGRAADAGAVCPGSPRAWRVLDALTGCMMLALAWWVWRALRADAGWQAGAKPPRCRVAPSIGAVKGAFVGDTSSTQPPGAMLLQWTRQAGPAVNFAMEPRTMKQSLFVRYPLGGVVEQHVVCCMRTGGRTGGLACAGCPRQMAPRSSTCGPDWCGRAVWRACSGTARPAPAPRSGWTMRKPTCGQCPLEGRRHALAAAACQS